MNAGPGFGCAAVDARAWPPCPTNASRQRTEGKESFVLATHSQIAAGSRGSPPLIGHVTARYDEKYYNRCYRNLLPVILTDEPEPLPQLPHNEHTYKYKYKYNVLSSRDPRC